MFRSKLYLNHNLIIRPLFPNRPTNVTIKWEVSQYGFFSILSKHSYLPAYRNLGGNKFLTLHTNLRTVFVVSPNIDMEY